MRHRRDKTHAELIGALRNRCGGYWRDENGAHHAHIKGLCVDAYDMHKAGSGFPDWIVFVSWLAIGIEIKNKDGRRSREDAKGFYTPAEEIFIKSFHGLRVTAYEQNEIYDLLCKAAQFVLAVDDMLAGHDKPEPLPKEFVDLFFPKAAYWTFTPEEMQQSEFVKQPAGDK